ncbi:MAG: hypothetical protein IT436_09890 [Phycisphaerales bacterium]|nr:hypothetical protein [Phycisphaerales bacterium]
MTLRLGRAVTGRGLLAGMRIRKKLVVLHTVFSLGLAAILLVGMRPAIGNVVEQAELNEARLVLSNVLAARDVVGGARTAEEWGQQIAGNVGHVEIRRGAASEVAIDAETAARAALRPGVPVATSPTKAGARAVVFDPAERHGEGSFLLAQVRIPEAREAVFRLYIFTIMALLGVYALVAIALEVFVLPQHVYGPIRRMLAAERAVQEGRPGEELIPESTIPADELGEIMRSRNESILGLRRHQRDLAEALGRLEVVANDLKRKNHLLEMARRNLADADRLASLGMMSAGIAHELNTPLAVLKGLVEKLNQNPAGGVDPDRAALMLRVVGRLERLSDSLLDFARVRPPQTRPVEFRSIVEEGITLVRLDREAAEVEIVNHVPAGLMVECDGDRMVQVMVNLLRNAIDAVRTGPAERRDSSKPPTVEISAEASRKDGREWVSIAVIDNGPGIEPEILPRLFEPFASTRLDSRGTGLGLAVADGIVREHSGVLLARNRGAQTGAVFEIMLPARGGVPVRE